jgi:AraC-like DNA-binding protein
VPPKASKLEPTVSVNVIRPIASMLQLSGAPAAQVLARHQISPELLDDVEGRVPLDRAYTLLDEATAIVDEDDLGLLMAERAPVGAMGVIAYVMATSDTLGEAYRRLPRLHRLVMDLGQVELHEEGDRARFVVRLPTSPDRVYRHVAEGFLYGWLRRGRELTGIHWNPLLVRFRHAAPAKLDNHERLFRAPILFGQRTDELELDRSLLALQIHSAEPRLARILDQYAAELLDRLPRADDLAGRVRQAVVKLTTGGVPTLWQVARSFHMTSRTLQRRLSEHELSFRQLVDEGRRELALRYVLRDDLSIGEVGYLVGFDSISSFHRAFRRWTGMTPARWRDDQKP